MLVYLSQFDSPDENYRQFQTLSSFHRDVLDSGATSIVCDGFLRTFEYEEIPELLKLIIKKLCFTPPNKKAAHTSPSSPTGYPPAHPPY